MTTAFINRIATALPEQDVHRAFVNFAQRILPEGTRSDLISPISK